MLLDRFRLDGRVAVVTGASSGLGVDFAVGLAEAGADLVIMARRGDRLASTRALVEATGRGCLAVTADVSDMDACRGVVDQAMQRFGRLDILVNNAGIASAAPASREAITEFARVLDVNLTGSLRMAQACASVMQPGASIVNVGSVIGAWRRSCSRECR